LSLDEKKVKNTVTIFDLSCIFSGGGLTILALKSVKPLKKKAGVTRKRLVIARYE
jgi:hypothetical protein